ncbi:hypothetical protein C0J52_22442 [Blattella germanica]|nr:hypothetical protein C0J52_22442 [Blattella germanica]
MKVETFSLILVLIVFVVIFYALRCLSFVADLVLLCCTIYLTEYFLKWMKDPLRTRSLIPDLRRKSILITGCDTGFGNEMARRLDSIGVTVFAGCLFPEGVGAHELKKSCSKNLQIIPMDVTDEEQINNALETVKTLLGDKQLWAIVNNAGITTSGDFELIPMKHIMNVMNVNAIGPLRVTKAFLPLIRKARGRIVIVASMAGRFSPPEMVPYCMSKHAAVSFADGLRREMFKFGVTKEIEMGQSNIRPPSKSYEVAPDDDDLRAERARAKTAVFIYIYF